jgi:hypothetical protein
MGRRKESDHGACQTTSPWSRNDHEDGGPTIQLPAAEARCTLCSLSYRRVYVSQRDYRRTIACSGLGRHLVNRLASRASTKRNGRKTRPCAGRGDLLKQDRLGGRTGGANRRASARDSSSVDRSSHPSIPVLNRDGSQIARSRLFRIDILTSNDQAAPDRQVASVLPAVEHPARTR